MPLRRVFLLLLPAIPLASWPFEIVPVKSASVIRHSTEAPGLLLAMSSTQVAALNDWLSSHRSGWSASYVSHVPRIQVQLSHTNGESSSLQLVAGKLIVYGGSGQQERALTAEEFNALFRLLSATAG